MRRGVLPILGVLCALPTGAPAADRLARACEVAVAVHANDVILRFDEARHTAGRIRLDFTFEGANGQTHRGVADCGFRPTSGATPPSLDHLEVMGRQGAGMFLKSFHAVWHHFAGPPVTLSQPEPSPAEPEEERRRKPRQPFA